MYAWEAVQKTVDYIEVQLEKEIEIRELAAVAALSPFYFQRLFSRLVKKPVMEYIKLRRLSRGTAYLREANRKIVDIALACGFGSHEVFSRAFKEAYGMTPDQFRKRPTFLNQFDKPQLLLQYTMVETGVPLIAEDIVLELNWRELEHAVVFEGVEGEVPVAGQIPVGEDTGVDIPGQLWEKFHQEKKRIKAKEKPREIGVAYIGSAAQGCFTYFTGLEVDGKEEMQEGFSRWELPPRKYLVAGFEAENFHQLTTVTLNHALKYCRMWTHSHDLVSDIYAPEIYYASSSEAAYMELWMPVDKRLH